ncbi:MAG: 4-hydroxy-3-methylbut-2-enyl diphosphate reductase, partial [Deltaproteobacteria bacterium]|nr:4-hydroxy-3-methylbut-2-enyl diphosphate reductase [Deltaproteobacteria bacterium]
MEVILAQPRGFCAGVVRAIETVELALELYEKPVFVFHEIVHNRRVVQDLESRGVIFVENLNDVPVGTRIIFSAHGVSPKVVEHAQRRSLRVIDATCPLVNKVHRQAEKYSQQGMEVIIIGHPDHPEVIGTRNRVEGPVHVLSFPTEVQGLRILNPNRLAYITQTTLGIDDTRGVIDVLKRRYPSIRGPSLSDICYATQHRQKAVHGMAKEIDVLLVVGSRNSSNSNRLREVGEQTGLSAYLIEDAQGINPNWLRDHERIGVTAGASTPEELVQGVLERLCDLGARR